MQTPGMLVLSNMASGAIEKTVSYAQIAEARGLRNFLVTESLTDSLARSPTYRQQDFTYSGRHRNHQPLPASPAAGGTPRDDH